MKSMKMTYLKSIFLFLFAIILISIPKSAKAEEEASFPVCGILSGEFKEEVKATEDSYYELTVEKTGWYVFSTIYSQNRDSITTAFIEVGTNGRKEDTLYHGVWKYLRADSLYYLRFCPQVTESTDLDDQGYEIGITSKQIFEFSVSCKLVSDSLIPEQIEMLKSKTSGVAYYDESHFAGNEIKISFRDGQSVTLSANIPEKFCGFEEENSHQYVILKVSSYLEQDGVIITDTSLSPGKYTAHVSVGTDEETTYEYTVADYKELGLTKLTEGTQKINPDQMYTFSPSRTGRYKIGKLIEIEFGAYIYPVIFRTDDRTRIPNAASAIDFEFQLEAGQEYVLYFLAEEYDVYPDQEIDVTYVPPYPSVVSVSGPFNLEKYYLKGIENNGVPYVLTITYDNGETAQVVKKDGYWGEPEDQYHNSLKMQFIHEDGTIINQKNIISIPEKEGSYTVKASFGGVEFWEGKTEVLPFNEYVKTLENFEENKTKAYTSKKRYSLIPKKDGQYWFVMSTDEKEFELYTLTENKDGTIYRSQADDEITYKTDSLNVKAGKAYIIIIDGGSGTVTVGHESEICKTTGHIYWDNRCSICNSYKTLETPRITSVDHVSSGIKIVWDKVPDASTYRIYRKTASQTSWTRIGENKSDWYSDPATSWIDKTAVAGTKYYYTVRCISADGTTFVSSYDKTGTPITCLATIKPTVNNVVNGVTISWSKVSGATGYIVYRKSGNGSYARIKEYTSGSSLSYTDTSPASGTTYTYAVRATAGTSKGYYTAVSIKYLKAITPALSNTTNGVKISWSKVTGATGYIVYRKSGSGSYARIKEYTSGSSLSFTDTSPASGTTYTYAVRATDGTTKGYYTGVSIKYLKAITPTLSNTTSGIKVSWSKVTGATGYRVYRKTGTGSYTRIAELSGNTKVSYVDTAVRTKKGTTYTYAVRAISGNYLGGYTGKTITR